MSIQQVPITPSMSRTLTPQSGGGLSGLVLFVLLVIVIAAIVLAVSIFVLVAGHSSPAGVFEEYIDASNDRDIYRMFDQTVLSFAPNYQQQLAILEQTVFLFDPVTTIISSDILLKQNMDANQIEYAEDLIWEVEVSLGIDVDDYCYVVCEYVTEYRELGGAKATFDTEILCVEISGDWYLAIPGYII